MTDKEKFAKDINVPRKEQIIIDGKGCRYKTWDAECSLTGDHYGDNMKPCKFIDEKSCYFKQLARKTQECEQLQEKYEALKLENEEGYEIVDDLKQECEELKEKLEKFYTLAGEPIEYFLDHYTNLCEDFLLDDRDEDDNTIPILEQIRDRLEDKDTLEEENTRYRKGLEEIEEIIKQTKQQVFCQHCAWYNTDGCDPSDKICGDFIKILDIIDKAKGEK